MLSIEAIALIGKQNGRRGAAADARADIIANAPGLPEAKKEEPDVEEAATIPAEPAASPSLAETLKAELDKKDAELRLAVTSVVDQAVAKLRAEDPAAAHKAAFEAQLEPFILPKSEEIAEEASTSFLSRRRKK